LIKNNFFSFFCSILALVLTLTYLIVRVFIGLDFTDEMQYYGQIYSLLLFNKLFVNDFFIQQTGYLLIYPFLKFILFFDSHLQFSNLIIYARLLLFLFIISLSSLFFFLSYNFRLISRVIGSCFVAIAISEYLPFAFSYNTVSYLLSSLILMLWFFFESRYKIYILSFLTVLLGWTYPPIGILFFILILVDNAIFSKKKNFFKIISSFFFFSFTLIVIIFTLNFLDIDTFIKSLIFSNYFSSSFVFFYKSIIFTTLIFIPGILFIFLILYENKFVIFIRKKYAFLFIFLSLSFFFFGFILIFNEDLWKFSILLWYASICIMFLAEEIDIFKKILLLKILFLSLLVSSVYSLMSGNGWTVSYRGFFLLIGFLYLVFPYRVYKKKLNRIYIDSLGTIIICGIIINILVNPYRDKIFFTTLFNVKNFLPYEKLYISKTKFLAINEIKKNIIIDKNKTLLVLGPHPWIYYALNAQPNTPYFFMHFVLSSNEKIEKVENFIIENLKTKRPHYIIDTLPNTSFNLKKKIEVLLTNYSCKEFIFSYDLNTLIKKEINFELPDEIKICEKN
jgi:hypothetical protein